MRQVEIKKLVKNILVITAILLTVFLSQSPYFRPFGEVFYKRGAEYASPYWSNASGWLKANIYPRVSGGVQTGGEVVSKEVVKQKNNFAAALWENIKNYFAEKFSKISGTKVE